MYSFVTDLLTNYLDEIITALATLVAAFGGAWFAFLLQNKKEKKKEIKENVTALNKVQINLTQQLNALTILNKDFVQPAKKHPIEWLAIPAIPKRDYSKLQIDAGSLAFLVEKGSASLISEILVVEEKFKEVINVLNLRSDVHVQQLQPKLAKMGFIEGKPFHLPLEEVERELGVQLVGTLNRLTNDLIRSTEDAIQSHENIIQAVKSTGKQIFPTNRIVEFQYTKKKEKYNKANSADAKSCAAD
jgi:hypothetical protein